MDCLVMLFYIKAVWIMLHFAGGWGRGGDSAFKKTLPIGSHHGECTRHDEMSPHCNISVPIDINVPSQIWVQWIAPFRQLKLYTKLHGEVTSPQTSPRRGISCAWYCWSCHPFCRRLVQSFTTGFVWEMLNDTHISETGGQVLSNLLGSIVSRARKLGLIKGHMQY